MGPTQTSGAHRKTTERDWPWDRIALFSGLDDAAITAITARLVLRSFRAGEALIEQDRWCGELFILRTGIVEISVGASASDAMGMREVPLRRLVSGECFGEMSLITGGPPSATVRALTDGEAWVLNQQDFQQLVGDHPSLARNINVILSERLLHTSRQQLGDSFQQIIVIVARQAPLWGELARALALLSVRPTLFIDFTQDGHAGTDAGAAYTLMDLLTGRLRAGAATPDGAQPARGGMLTIVRGAGGDGDAVARAVDLPVALNRLGDTYRQVLIVLPPGHPQLMPHLLAFANRVLVAGAMGDRAGFQAMLASLPAPAYLRERLDLGLILTETPDGITPTVAALDRYTKEYVMPVRALVPGVGARRAAVVGALARWLVRQRIGLVLGVGGPKGWAHVGVYRALRRAGIPFDCIAGVSIGSMVGAMIAGGFADDAIEARFREGTSHVFHFAVPYSSLLSSRALAAWLRNEVFGQRLIEDLPIPMAIGAADLNSGSEILIRRGPIWKAVLASSAIPAVYPPVRIGPYCLIDGGVMNPVPVSTARMLGADVVVAVDLSTPLSPPQTVALEGRSARKLPNMLATTLRSYDIMTAEMRSRTVGEPSVLIKPNVVAMSLRKFSDGARFIAAGEEAAEAALPLLYQQLPWLERLTDSE